MARALKGWMAQLENHRNSKTFRDRTLASLSLLLRKNFLFNASADIFLITANEVALSNAARRSVWPRSWSGDAGLSSLRGFLCEGDLLFGSGLQDIPGKAKFYQQRKCSRVPRKGRQKEVKKGGSTTHGRPSNKGKRDFYFSTTEIPSRSTR